MYEENSIALLEEKEINFTCLSGLLVVFALGK